MNSSGISAIMLAAGLSARMGGRDKLLLEYMGKTLLQRAVELLDSLPVSEKILVTTGARLKHICDLPCLAVPGVTAGETAARAPGAPPAIRVVINPAPETGQSKSLRLGLGAASGEWFLFLTGDQPLLTPGHIQPMLELAERNADKIIFPSINGKPCSPSLFAASFRDELLSLTGDTGGRAVRDKSPQACLAFVAEYPEGFIDIDDEAGYLTLL